MNDAYTPVYLPATPITPRDLALDRYSDQTVAIVTALVKDKIAGCPGYSPAWLDGFDWSTAGARLSRRIASTVYRSTGIRLPQQIVQAIGDFSAHERVLRVEYDVTDRFDWNPGDYADEGSCFWGGWVRARAEVLPRLGARCLRFYRDGVGSGRCWILPLPPMLDGHRLDGRPRFVTFNYFGEAADVARTEVVVRAYLRDALGGDWTATDAARFEMAEVFVNPYAVKVYAERCATLDGHRLDAERCAPDGLIEIGPEWAARSTVPTPEWGSNILAVSPPACVVCTDVAPLDEMRLHDGAYYCAYCFGEVFDRCALCGDYHHHADTRHVWAGTRVGDCMAVQVCPECYTYHVCKCDTCEEMWVKSFPDGSTATRRFTPHPCVVTRDRAGHLKTYCADCGENK